jgi:hypothetical protein
MYVTINEGLCYTIKKKIVEAAVLERLGQAARTSRKCS